MFVWIREVNPSLNPIFWRYVVVDNGFGSAENDIAQHVISVCSYCNLGRLTLKGAGILIVFRLGIFWFLLFLHWTERLGYAALVLMIFLMPEALALPRNFDWTLGKAFGVSGLLSAGSFFWSLAAVSIVRKTGKFSGN